MFRARAWVEWCSQSNVFFVHSLKAWVVAMIDLSIFSQQEFEFWDRHGRLVRGMNRVCAVMM